MNRLLAVCGAFLPLWLHAEPSQDPVLGLEIGQRCQSALEAEYQRGSTFIEPLYQQDGNAFAYFNTRYFGHDAQSFYSCIAGKLDLLSIRYSSDSKAALIKLFDTVYLPMRLKFGKPFYNGRALSPSIRLKAAIDPHDLRSEFMDTAIWRVSRDMTVVMSVEESLQFPGKWQFSVDLSGPVMTAFEDFNGDLSGEAAGQGVESIDR
ncbi:hypothetical protein A11A3_15067 [Alcanivorax hongdengensis A-11-3]|uniref:Uncharacterized protein n=1 Tax=Alcanivorax hongdengensis A-11-3 TaxID=1177179 RepID=L0W842_9GAMM|nr:hypothetical protein [Alcanivorax hongdengensis]EKF73134.1 hypothetical protein A11A3_15067 [Alcanivorax hongdengensis A-11-3]